MARNDGYYAVSSVKAITSSIEAASQKSITSRSTPSAMPPQSGRWGTALQKALRDRRERLPFPAYLLHCFAEALRLLGGVGKLTVGVGQLQSTDEDLRPLSDCRVGRP